tara:strand:- start:14489 stop:15133 length:645 start_codon:yes stop_codon:yes gene_type:complete
MSKISNTASYPTVTPADGDLLIGTDVNDNDATKTFTIGSINALTPADTLSEVLTAGNTATNNIVLTGDISCTNLTSTTAISGATVTGTTSVTTPLVVPTDIQDGSTATGSAGQYLRKSSPGNVLAWETVGDNTLSEVLTAGNSAANGITLTGATGFITTNAKNLLNGNIPIKFNTLSAYRDDAAAGAAGLVTGEIYQTDATNPTLGAGVLMVKQ